jgi:hypothetical protein
MGEYPYATSIFVALAGAKQTLGTGTTQELQPVPPEDHYLHRQPMTVLAQLSDAQERVPIQLGFVALSSISNSELFQVA